MNGEAINIPAILEDGRIKASLQSGQPTIQTDFGLQVTSDSEGALIVTLPSSYYGTTCGLCGNFNEDSSDDMTYLNGTQASSVMDWTNSWKVNDHDLTCSDSCK